MEDRAFINENGSLDDRKKLREFHVNKDWDAIKETEDNILYHAQTVGRLKKEGLCYQWHENKCNALRVEMDKQTKEFLFKY